MSLNKRDQCPALISFTLFKSNVHNKTLELGIVERQIKEYQTGKIIFSINFIVTS